MINMSTLTIKHKIDLFNKLYKEISGHGINGDTELVVDGGSTLLSTNYSSSSTWLSVHKRTIELDII